MNQGLSYLPFHAERAQVETDPDRHAANYALVAPLLDFVARSGTPYRAEWVAARSGAVTLLAGTTTALLSEMSGSHPTATLHIPFAGEAVFKAERRQLIGAPGATAVYLPGMPRRTETPFWAGLSLGLDPHRLAACAAAMAGQPDSPEWFLPRFMEPLQLDQSDRVVAFLVGHLGRIVDLIDLEPSRSFELAASLPLGPMIEQAVAALVIPSLVGG
ncbi:MAG: hypothetical protein VKI42_05240 [Synechococcaceae cyanobacterium]|nr:hypothetical protein [Synechococcaceae cyanobacterium]